MKKENHATLNYLINLSFFLYFAILLSERVISVVLSIVNGVNLYANAFNAYLYTLVFISIIGFIIYLLLKCRDNIKGLFQKPNEKMKFAHLSIASGILLLSGMVHTEYTIPVIQFVSYGILIIGLLLQVIINISKGGNKTLHWLSFIYLVSFSMAIPVMYHSNIELATLFHIAEAISSVLLVGIFTCFLLMLFAGKDDLFIITPVLSMIVFDSALIVLRWKEEINYFVLIFASLSLVIFIIGFIYKKIKRNKK